MPSLSTCFFFLSTFLVWLLLLTVEFSEAGYTCSLVLMESEDAQHATSPVKLEYLMQSSEEKLLCQTTPSSVGSDLDGLTTPKALSVWCISRCIPRVALLQG